MNAMTYLSILFLSVSIGCCPNRTTFQTGSERYSGNLINGASQPVTGYLAAYLSPQPPSFWIQIQENSRTQPLDKLTYTMELYRDLPCASAAGADAVRLVQSFETITLSKTAGETAFETADPSSLEVNSASLPLDGKTVLLRLTQPDQDLDNALVCAALTYHPASYRSVDSCNY